MRSSEGKARFPHRLPKDVLDGEGNNDRFVLVHLLHNSMASNEKQQDCAIFDRF